MTRTKGGTGGRKIPVGPDGLPISGADLRRWRVRQAEARSETLSAPLDRAEQAYQRAARAEAVAEEAARSAEQDRAAAAEARRAYERLRAEERARAEQDRERRGQPIARQHSSSGGDPFSGDIEHHPEICRMIMSGVPMASVNARMAELRAERERNRADRDRHQAETGIHGGGSIMWRTASGGTMLDDSRVRPREQVSTVHTGTPELGTDAVLGGPTNRHFEAPVTGHAPGTRPPKVSESYWSTSPADHTLAHPEGSES